MQIKINVFPLIKQLELKHGYSLSYAEIARVTELDQRVIAGVITGKTKQIRTDTLAKLLDFFRREGMPVTVGDLFTEVEESN